MGDPDSCQERSTIRISLQLCLIGHYYDFHKGFPYVKWNLLFVCVSTAFHMCNRRLIHWARKFPLPLLLFTYCCRLIITECLNTLLFNLFIFRTLSLVVLQRKLNTLYWSVALPFHFVISFTRNIFWLNDSEPSNYE